MILPPPRSTLFPYTTLFRSVTISSTTPLYGALTVDLDDCVFTVFNCERKAATWFFACFNSNSVPTPRSKRSEEHTSELQSRPHLVCRLLLEKKKKKYTKSQE